MKYIGRLSLLCISVTVSTIEYILGETLTGLSVVESICMAVLALWMGSAFDKLRYFRKEAERSKQQIHMILESISDAFFTVDQYGRFVYVNQEAQTILDKTAEELLGNNFWETFPEAKYYDFYKYYQQALHLRKDAAYELFYEPLDKWLTVRSYPSKEGTSVFFMDISERKQAEAELVRVKNELAIIFKHSGTGIALTDLTGKVVRTNDFLQTMLGYSEEELSGMSVTHVTHPDDMQADLDMLQRALQEEQSFYQLEKRYIKKNGDIFPAKLTVSIIRNKNGAPEYTIGIVEDITKQQEMMQALQYLSSVDSLTQILNRRSFEEALHAEWQRALEYNWPLSILMIDIDFFKGFNDQYGHQAGDVCLQQVSQALQATIKRPRDLAARYGGEEFVILLPEADTRSAHIVAEQLRAAIYNLNILNEASMIAPYVTVSIGCATIIPNSEHTPMDMVGFADKALYTAKESGKNQVQSYQISESAC